MTEQELVEILGPPETEQLARRDGKPVGKGLPSQLIKATGWEDNWIDEDDEDIQVFDFGEAFLKGAEPEKLPQPSHLKAPETIFMDSYDSRHDLWRAGIMLGTIMTSSDWGLFKLLTSHRVEELTLPSALCPKASTFSCLVSALKVKLHGPIHTHGCDGQPLRHGLRANL